MPLRGTVASCWSAFTELVVTSAFHGHTKFCENIFMDFRKKKKKKEEVEIPASDQTCMHILPEGQYREDILFPHI